MEYLQRVSRFEDLARTYWVDALIALLAIAGMLELVVARNSASDPPTDLWLSVLLLAVLVAPIFARRRFPFGGPLAYWVLAPAITFYDGELIPFIGSLGVVGLATAFMLGNLRNGLKAGIGLAVITVGIVTVVYNIPGTTTTSNFVFITLRFVVAWLAGYALRERAEQAEAAEERAIQAERERETAARVAVAEERARIARELHDIVAHAVSVMVLQVGAVSHKLPDSLAEDREALRSVERAGRTALTEMRRLLSAMRHDGEEVELGPQPGLDGLDALLDDVGRAGLPVELHVDGQPFPLPRGVDLSAYRIVQEGLTNALKHAHASDADVIVRYRPDELEIEVRDNGQGSATSDGQGHGLVGVRERVKIYGGEMSAGTSDEGGFVLSTRLPVGGEASVTIRVLVADDQSMVRAGFRMLLAGEEDIDVVAEASNGLEAVEKADRFRPDVVLMDIRMPELDGLEATRRILAADNGARILVLTTFDLDEYVYEALRAGASGFVLKDDPPEQLLAAIHVVAGGNALLSPAVTKRVIKQFTRTPRPSPPKELEDLSEREQEVFRLIARGLSNAEIGKELYISETTVKTHVTHILQKLDLRDRVQVVVLAYQSGLLEGNGGTGGDDAHAG